jgi:hypothetical protein
MNTRVAKLTKKTTILALAGASLAAVLLFATLGTQSAQASERAKVHDPYGAYLLNADIVYTFIQQGSWQYDLYTTQAANTQAFVHWYCLDDSNQPIPNCIIPVKDTTSFMLFVKNNKDRIYFDKVVNGQNGNSLNHEVRAWLLKAYLDNLQKDGSTAKNLKQLNQKEMAKEVTAAAYAYAKAHP